MSRYTAVCLPIPGIEVVFYFSKLLPASYLAVTMTVKPNDGTSLRGATEAIQKNKH
ncbi:MAG: hypothetical protein FWD66_09055 [Paludibacter sp.]|nr:hypothetical protein [Paludibacter sp.]